MQRAELLGETFQVAEGFSISSFLTSAWGVMGGEETVQVRLRFTAEVTRRVKESLWHPLQVIEDLPDLSGYQVYACGAPVMVESAQRDFTSHHRLPDDEFYAASFTSAADLANPV